jgi:ankyrin repeat protein
LIIIEQVSPEETKRQQKDETSGALDYPSSSMKAKSQELLDNPVTDQQNLLMIAARCNVDIQNDSGRTALQAAELQGHAGIATLIKNKNHKGAARAMKGTLLQKKKAKKRTEAKAESEKKTESVSAAEAAAAKMDDAEEEKVKNK